MFYTRFLSPTDQKCAESSTYGQFYYRPPGKFLQRAISLKCDTKNSTYILYIYMYITTLSIIIWIISIGNTKIHVATLTCLEWLLSTVICWYFHYSCSKLTSHTCALLIDNAGNYSYLNNGSFTSEVDPHQFNLREREKKIFKSWQVCDWLAKWLIVLGFMEGGRGFIGVPTSVLSLSGKSIMLLQSLNLFNVWWPNSPMVLYTYILGVLCSWI